MYEYRSISETCRELNTDKNRGLSGEEASYRLNRDGENVLASPGKKTVVESFLEQLCDPLIYVLLAAAAVSFLLRETADALIILTVVGMNAVVGMLQEGKAQKALEALKKLTSPKACVIRDGTEQEIPASELVKGDLVRLEAGCQVPADLRLVRTSSLKAEESALTGESLPIEKQAEFTAGVLKDRMGNVKELPLGDRKNLAYMSTLVTHGRGDGIVTATGMETEIGRIAGLINESREEITPLQKRLGELGKVLSILSVGLCAALFLIGVLQKRDLFEMLITAISLAVAAVPEGLPAVVTICLALSVTRMAKVHTIVRKLPCVETLGAVNVVCSDKTGTLTQNRMRVVQCYVNQTMQSCEQENRSLWSTEYKELLTAMALCNDAVLKEDGQIGDATELALLTLAAGEGITRERLELCMPRLSELAFDSERKMMSTFHRKGDQTVAYTKGAPDEVLKHCTYILLNGRTVLLTEQHRASIRRAQEEMAHHALRTLAAAMRAGGSRLSEQELTFLGMVGMEDPIRPEAAEAVEEFRRAGVRTIMITGDHADTALAIARQLGIARQEEQCMTGEEISGLSEEKLRRRLSDVRVFARVSPEHKVRIVRSLKSMGNIVAMTGDGVNDAPSLKYADVGIAMGKGGTDVARQAADIVLTDDNFATIEKAIEEGRGVYENIRKSVIFLLSSNMGEILTMFLAVFFGLSSPLRSSHILWINLITDSLPALALGVDKNDVKQLMERPPRSAKESLFADGGLACTCFYGILIAGVSLTAFFTIPYTMLRDSGLPFSLAAVRMLLFREAILMRSQTYAFTVLGMSQLFHAVGMRDIHTSVFHRNPLENPLMWLAWITGLLLQLAVTEIPFLTTAFGTAHLDVKEWLWLALLASFPLLAHEIMVLCAGKRVRKSPARALDKQNFRDIMTIIGEKRMP